ncbi:OmpA/MotB family protein [Nocardioides pantholopis]|uniref:OmpA/MotB family protein n=1 Tax=Nocardioides pantholopis TaxID=2483798 RepID=UPI000FD70768|nr:flagellar motor protein MotB [Nocardioides pantholopis]
MAARRRPKRHVEEEHEDSERWLVTYADLITLLMALFIILYAMSYTDTEKYTALKQGLAVGFGEASVVQDGGTSLLKETGSSAISAVAAKQVPDAAFVAPRTADADVEVRNAARKELARLRDIETRLRRALRAEGLSSDVRTSYDERGLVVSLVSRHVVFRNDLATLSPRGERVVDVLGPVLAGLSDDLEIAGNTNQVDVKPAYFNTDWDLSSARAITVLRRLEERLGIATARLAVAGYGVTRPLIDPSQPESQAVNKRVDVVVLSAAEAAVRELLPDLARSTTTQEGTTR